MSQQPSTAAPSSNPGHPRFLIVEGRFYDDIADMLLTGATRALEAAGATFDRATVPGALEIPPAIAIGLDTGRYDGFVALGCVIRGETSHYDIVAGESARGLMDLGDPARCRSSGTVSSPLTTPIRRGSVRSRKERTRAEVLPRRPLRCCGCVDV